MNTKISAKLAALAIALTMNCLIIGGVAYLFDAQTQPHMTVMPGFGFGSSAVIGTRVS